MFDRCPTPTDEVELTLDEDVEKVVKYDRIENATRVVIEHLRANDRSGGGSKLGYPGGYSPAPQFASPPGIASHPRTAHFLNRFFTP